MLYKFEMIISTDKDILDSTKLSCNPLTVDILEKFGWVGTKDINRSTQTYLDVLYTLYTCPKYKGWTVYNDINTFYILSPWTPDEPVTVNVVGTYSDILRIINS